MEKFSARTSFQLAPLRRRKSAQNQLQQASFGRREIGLAEQDKRRVQANKFAAASPEPKRVAKCGSGATVARQVHQFHLGAARLSRATISPERTAQRASESAAQSLRAPGGERARERKRAKI